MGISSVAAATVAFATAGGPSAISAPTVNEAAQCIFEPAALSVDASVGPLLVSTVAERRLGIAVPQGQWGQAALRPYDVMSSLGSGSSPALPTGLSLADAPVPLPVSSPLTWVLATAGLLGMLYVRRTQL
jgi:hypothetical protein